MYHKLDPIFVLDYNYVSIKFPFLNSLYIIVAGIYGTRDLALTSVRMLHNLDVIKKK